MVFNHGGHPAAVGAVLSGEETERFHLQVNQITPWIPPRDILLHCISDLCAILLGRFRLGGCWPLDGSCSCMYVLSSTLVARGNEGWFVWVTLGIHF